MLEWNELGKPNIIPVSSVHLHLRRYVVKKKKKTFVYLNCYRIHLHYFFFFSENLGSGLNASPGK